MRNYRADSQSHLRPNPRRDNPNRKQIKAMCNSELIKAILGMFPILRCSDNFADDIDGYFKDYLKIIDLLDIDNFASQGDKEEVKVKITDLKHAVSSILDLSFRGQTFDSTKLFMNTIAGELGFINNIEVYRIEQNSLLYRARINENDKCFTHNEMFHIPFNKREKVQSYRYSKAGHPCLYLGSCPEVCCRELGEENRTNINISKFKARRSFDVYDLRIPVAEDFTKDKIKSTLLRIPLVVLCSIKVRDHRDPYKQEYIIPQMFIETIYSQNAKLVQSDCGIDDVIWGIIYSSTKVEDYVKHDRYSNIVLPSIIVAWNSKYCHKLASLFEITDSYKLGESEEKAFHTLPHLYLNVPKSGITLNSDGDVVNVKVISSGDFIIE